MVLTREITFEEGWSNIQKGVTKLIRILEGEPEPEFTPNEYIAVYTTVYDMCNQKPYYKQQLHDRYLQVIEDYVKQRVLPSLKEKHDESMLTELVKRWNNHKVMVRWLYNFFTYLERCSNQRNRRPLKEAGLTCFHDLVYPEIQSNANEAVIALIHKEREGEQIDRDLVKNVLDVYVENGMGTMKKYEDDFESFMLQETASYYSQKASRWIQEDSCSNYMLKSEECLKRERERVTHYLHSSTEPKLVEKVQNELLVVFAKQLLENEHSGCRALLRDDKKDDLSRMYRLYKPIPQGLEPVADLFKQHITREGNTLIKQADDAATDQVVMRKVTELHYKYMGYVTECFQNHTLFNKALKEAFETKQWLEFPMQNYFR